MIIQVIIKILELGKMLLNSVVDGAREATADQNATDRDLIGRRLTDIDLIGCNFDTRLIIRALIYSSVTLYRDYLI